MNRVNVYPYIYADRLYTTVGVHPTRARDWANYPDGPERYIEELADVIQDGVQDGTVVAIGECGLDYDRLEFCDAETQKACFKAHFALAQQFHLPMFLHSRAAGEDFQNFMLTYHSMMPRGGVVHSFDGSLEEMKAILKFDNICIGINGCSLKTEENLAVVAQIPLPVLMLETDAPWCGIRPSHASSHHIKTDILAKDKKKYAKGCQVKGRNEPANIVQIAEVIAGIQGTIVEQVTEHAFVNTIKMFFPSIKP